MIAFVDRRGRVDTDVKGGAIRQMSQDEGVRPDPLDQLDVGGNRLRFVGAHQDNLFGPYAQGHRSLAERG